jgi:hypothetical protein
MQFNTGYYQAMDRYHVSVDPENEDLAEPITAEDKNQNNINLAPKNLGIGANPFAHPRQSVNARLHDGASKMEISFFGQGKGNKDRFTPESIDKAEREDIRNLAKLNNAKISTHATVAVEGLAGFGKEGFDERQRQVAMDEISKAIDFAAEATTGGAIVFHTGEWQRPISEQQFGVSNKGEFEGFVSEKDKATIMVADEQTGQITAVRKDHDVFEPEFHDVESFSKQQEYEKNSNGDYVDKNGEIIFNYLGKDSEGINIYKDKTGHKIYGDDWVNMRGEFIDPRDTDGWFERIPKWDKDKTNFKIGKRNFEYFENQAQRYKERYGQDISPEELFFKSQLNNQVLQAKGGSLYHAKEYDHLKKTRDKLLEAYKYYEKLDESLPEEEKWRLLEKKETLGRFEIKPEYESIPKKLAEQIKHTEDQMRYIHEASASSDAQAKQAEDRIKKIKTVEEVGLSKTADSIANLAQKVWQKNQNKVDKDQEDLYLAPENWQTSMFGGHPEEMIKIVERSRKEFINKNKNLMGEEKAKEAAKKVIKSTIDVGHLNVWRKHFKRNEGEDDKTFNKRFDNWLLKEIDKMHEKGILGHFHLADNFGYDDEHLTPGRGNAPIADFVKKLKDKGYDDFIIEAGSFNPVSALHDTWSYFGTPVYSSHPRGSFRSKRHGHFAYKSTPLYIAGAYAPSNQFKNWTEVPLH